MAAIGSSKQPWYHHRGEQLFYMAGVHQSGIGCAVVTQPATVSLAEIHHRQPVLLDEQHLCGMAQWGTAI